MILKQDIYTTDEFLKGHYQQCYSLSIQQWPIRGIHFGKQFSGWGVN